MGWPAHIKVKLTTGGAKVKIVRDRNIGTDRDERTAMRDHSASSAAAVVAAAAAPAPAKKYLQYYVVPEFTA